MGRKWHSRIFHEPVDDGRQRSIYPLPTLKGSGEIHRKVCSSVQKRLHRREHIRQRVNMAIDAMNSMFYGGSVPEVGPVEDLSVLPLGQRECIRGIVQKITAFGAPPPAASRSRALQALRASSGGYSEPEAGVGDVVNMELSSLSLPSGLVAGVNLVDSLEGPLQEMVKDFENWMLQDAGTWSSICDEAYKIKPYNDPSLADRSQYICFLQHLNRCGILGTSRCCRGRVGAFCVSKKPKVQDGKLIQRQRLILDCRQVNMQFRDPPHCELGALSAVSELVLESGQSLWVSGADIQDCFYAAKISEDLSSFFCLLSDLSRDEAFAVFGEHVESWGDRISPCITVLPMGFSWSFYLIQKLHEQSALRSIGGDRSGLILDGYPAPHLTGDSVVAMPYCDNLHCLSLDEEACQRGKVAMSRDLTNMGFSLHEDVDATDCFQTLGGVIDGKNGVVRPTSTRAWDIILAFESLLDGLVDWVVLRRLLGHAMTICTINRCGMSVFRALYDMVESAPHPRRLNKKERQEVKNFIGLVPMLVGEMRRTWCKTVSCSDASSEGFGVCQRDLPTSQVQQLGSWMDRWRFRHLAPDDWRPRERAEGLDPLRDWETARAFPQVEKLEDVYEYNNFFPEVPHEVTDPGFWQTKLIGKWSNTSDHITVKEGRALVLAVKRLCRSSASRGHRHLILLDSFSLCMAVCKGRASSFKLLRVMQQISALSLAGGFTVRVRWVPSERNVADAPSRGQIKPGAYSAPSCGEFCPDKSSQAEPQSQVKQFGSFKQECQTVGGNTAYEESEVSFSHEGSPIQEDSSSWKSEAAKVTGSDKGSDRRGQASGCGKQADSSGTEVSFERDRESVCRLLPTVREFLPGRRIVPASQRCHRRPHDGVHGPDGFRRPKCSRRRKSSSKCGISPQQAERAYGAVKKSFERMEKGDASLVSGSQYRSSLPMECPC